MQANSGRRITQYEVASLFSDAYCSTSNIQKCVNGFRAAGIYPLNSAVFTDEDFQAAENLMGLPRSDIPTASASTGGEKSVNTTITSAVGPSNVTVEMEQVPESAESRSTSADGVTSVNIIDAAGGPSNATVEIELVPESSESPSSSAAEVISVNTTGPCNSAVEMEPVPTSSESVSTSADGDRPISGETTVENTTTTTTTSSSAALNGVMVELDSAPTPHVKKRVSVADLSPLPTGIQKENARRRKCKRSEIFTASPMKVILEAKEQKKQTKEQKKQAKEQKKEKGTKKKENVKPAGDKGKRKASGGENPKGKRQKKSTAKDLTTGLTLA